MACEILVPRTGIKPTPPALEAWSPWTAREASPLRVLICDFTHFFCDCVCAAMCPLFLYVCVSLCMYLNDNFKMY